MHYTVSQLNVPSTDIYSRQPVLHHFYACNAYSISGGGTMYLGHLAGHPSIVHQSADTYFMWHDISLCSGGISIKLTTNIYQVSVHCWKHFQGHSSKVKVTESFSGKGLPIDDLPLTFIWFVLVFFVNFAFYLEVVWLRTHVKSLHFLPFTSFSVNKIATIVLTGVRSGRLFPQRDDKKFHPMNRFSETNLSEEMEKPQPATEVWTI